MMKAMTAKARIPPVGDPVNGRLVIGLDVVGVLLPSAAVVEVAPPTAVVEVAPPTAVVEVAPPTAVVDVEEVEVVGEGEVGSVGTLKSQVGVVKVLLSSVTDPLIARARPWTVTPLVTVIEVKAMRFPAKTELVPSVAELPICQNTLHS